MRVTRRRFATVLRQKLRSARYVSGNEVEKAWKEFQDSLLETSQECVKFKEDAWTKEVLLLS